jgi:predicted MFS family arabinose efflux permease
MLTPLAEAFHAPAYRAAWLVSGYALSYALLAPFVGLLSDRVGRRRLLLPALLLFAADALILTVAPNLGFAIGFRIVGGMAGAALTPTAFALISEVVPRERQAGAMGLVLFGLTLGIATGPTIAGLLTEHLGWRAPFIATAGGCVLVFLLGLAVLPRSAPEAGRSLRRSAGRLVEGDILRPMLSKGAWLGSAIAGFLLSGEVLRARYGLDTAAVGAAVAVFGIGLAGGNLAVGRLGRSFGGSEPLLLAAIGLILATQSLFLVLALPLAASLLLLGLWGFGCGLAAPANTAIQAERAGADAGFVLASSETMNNGVLLLMMPIAALWVAQGSIGRTAALLGSVGALAGVVNLLDRRRRRAAPIADRDPPMTDTRQA